MLEKDATDSRAWKGGRVTTSPIPALAFALDGLTAQQHTIANNLANVNTPGFLATNVSFESELATALAHGGMASARLVPSTNPVGLDGNNVSMGNQLIRLETNSLQYQAVSEQLTTQFQILSGSMGGQF
jgi:flagellar basal-body rod protein FlgB